MEQIHKIKNDRIRSRRAVAPIIATLLMIAIAVVGGVMIYVFTQGFFGNSSISTSPTVDTITMSGYDMREIVADGTAGVTTHEGVVLAVGVGAHGDNAATGGQKTTDEEGTIFLRNVGAKSYTISKLEVNGLALTFVSTNATLTAGTYGIYTIPNTAASSAGASMGTAPTILAGEDGTIIVSFDASNAATTGRTIPVKITSAGGSVYNFNVVIGSKV